MVTTLSVGVVTPPTGNMAVLRGSFTLAGSPCQGGKQRIYGLSSILPIDFPIYRCRDVLLVTILPTRFCIYR